jgi:hypothetical protein
MMLLATVLTAAGCSVSPAQDPPARALKFFSRESRGGQFAVEPVKPWPATSRPAPRGSRNPFVFGGTDGRRAARGKLAPLPPAESLPELPLPLAQPVLQLIGIASDETSTPTRTAIITVAGDLQLAREGDTIVGRYRVTRIDAQSVELLDSVAQQTLHLAMK